MLKVFWTEKYLIKYLFRTMINAIGLEIDLWKNMICNDIKKK